MPKWLTVLSLNVLVSGMGYSLMAPADSALDIPAAAPVIYSPMGSAIRFQQLSRSLELPQRDGTTAALGGQTWSIAWGDANNNLYPDLYLNHHTPGSTGRPEVPEAHLLFDPGLAIGEAGWVELGRGDQHGAIFVDVNADGQQDIFELSGGDSGSAAEISLAEPNHLFLGADGAFANTDVASRYQLQYRLARGRNPAPLNIGGQLGLILANAPRMEGAFPTNFVLRNAAGEFAEQPTFFRTEKCPGPAIPGKNCTADGVADLTLYRLALPGHFNRDNFLDVLFLSTESITGARVGLFLGREDGTFEIAKDAEINIRAKDAALLDADNDGQLDLWLTGMPIEHNRPRLGNSLYTFSPPLGFVQRSSLDGRLDQRLKTFALVTGDFDNDRDEDVVTYEGSPDGFFHFSIWENNGEGHFRRSHFFDRENPGIPLSVAVADYDLDGSLDLLFGDGRRNPTVAHNKGGYILLRGLPGGNHWLEIDLKDPWQLRGLGARVYVTTAGVTMLRGQYGGVHEAAQNNTRLHFGLGDAQSADVLVLWNDGTTTTVNGVTANQILQVNYTAKR